MVIFPGEGAVESFVERFTVLFVSFDCGQDHLRVRKHLEHGRGGGMERSEWKVVEKQKEEMDY